jgi:hypothetical protein
MILNVGTDCDGVIYDFGNALLKYFHSIGLKLSWKDGGVEPHAWNFNSHWGMSDAEFLQHCHDAVDAGILFRGPARPGAEETMWEIHNQGHELTLITDRFFGSDPEKSFEATYKWLWEDNNFPAMRVEFSPDKTSVETDVFIEDKLENYDALIAHGTPCALVTKPWNGDPLDGRSRIRDITDYPKFISRVYQPV